MVNAALGQEQGSVRILKTWRGLTLRFEPGQAGTFDLRLLLHMIASAKNRC